MPRRTPVKELQKEEVIGSPLRRSSRISNSSPVPTKVVTRRNSASEASTSTAKATRGRRSSLTQETEPSDVQPEKKKATATIRTRQSLLTSNDDRTEEAPKTRTRGSSVPKEQPDVKKTPRRRRSITEEAEVEEEPIKKITRSRSGSLTKKSDTDDTKPTNKKESAASTPVKKSPPENANAALEPIEETNKEIDSPEEKSSTKVKKKKPEASKLDFDLSVINEASLTEEEISPQKKANLSEVEESPSNNEVEPESKKRLSNTQKDQKATQDSNTTLPTAVVLVEKLEQKLDSSVTKEITPKKNVDGERLDSSLPTAVVVIEKLDSSVTKKNVNRERVDSCESDSSFTLQLSSSATENISQKETETRDINNKENVCPKETECEPMDVDEFENPSPVKISRKSLNRSGGMSVEKVEDVEKITEEIDQFLTEKIHLPSRAEKIEEGKQLKVQNDVVAAVSVGEKKESVSKIENGLALEETKSNLKEIKPGGKLPNINRDADQTKETDRVMESKIAPAVDKEVSDKVGPQKIPVEMEVEEDISSIENEVETSVDSRTISNELDLLESPANTETKSPKKDSIKTRGTPVTKTKESPSHEKIAAASPSDENGVDKETDVVDKETCTKESPIAETSNQDKKELSENPDSPPFQEFHIEYSDDDVEETETGKAITILDETSEEIDGTNETEDIRNAEKEQTPMHVKKTLFSNEESSEDDLDLEVTNINENKEPAEDDLYDLDSISEEDEQYRSPVKKPRTHCSLSDDEILTAKKDKTQKSKNVHKFERSIDSKYCGPTRPNPFDSSDDEVILLSDNELEEEKVEPSNNEVNKSNKEEENIDEISVKSASPNADPDVQENGVEEEDTDGENVTDTTFNKNVEEKGKDNSILTHSSTRRSLDKTSITMQETLKAGDDTEKSLSGRIHKVVDLFCAGIKNKADVSINVSLEYTGQLSDSENEGNDLVEISLTACDVTEKESEICKGSKRRKICPEKTPQKLQEEESTDEVSPNVSVKKSPKRRSAVSEDVNNSTPKVSPKVCVLTDQLVKSATKIKSRRSVADAEADEGSTKESKTRKSPGKKPVSSSSEKSKRDEEESSDDEEKSEENIVSPKVSVLTDQGQVKSATKIKARRSVADAEADEGSTKRKSPGKKPVSSSSEKSKRDEEESSDDEEKNEENIISPSQDSKCDEKKVRSAKKTKNRRSTICADLDNSTIKISPKASFSTNGEERVKSAKKSTPRRSTLDVDGSPVKKQVNSVPFELSDEESGESSDDDQNNDDSLISQSKDSTHYYNIFSTSLEDTDENDTTWRADAELDSSNSEIDVDESDAEKVDEEESPVGHKRKSSSSSSKDSVFLDAVLPTKPSPKTYKNRKLFRLSKYNMSQGFASSEFEESLQKKQKLEKPSKNETTTSRTEKEDKSKSKKKSKEIFSESKHMKSMLPQTSETGKNEAQGKKNRKRKRSNRVKSDEQDPVKVQPETAGFVSKKKAKPAAGNKKNEKSLFMKPSKRTSSGWDVTSFS